MTERLYHDTYTGPRWTYALELRPISLFNLPKAFEAQVILLSQRPHPQYRHGTIDYAVRLPDGVADHFSLVLVEERV